MVDKREVILPFDHFETLIVRCEAAEARVKHLETLLQDTTELGDAWKMSEHEGTALLLKERAENARLRKAIIAARDLFGAHAAKSVHIESVFEHFSDAEDLMNKALESTS